MATYDWIGGNGDWSDAAAWTNGPNPPPNGSTAVVNIGTPDSEVTIEPGQRFHAGPVTIGDASAALDLAGTATLSVSGDFANNGTLALDASSNDGGGSLTIGGTMTNHGTVRIGADVLSAGATLNLGALVNDSGSYFELHGSASSSAKVSMHGPAVNSGALHMGSGAILNIAGGDFTQYATGSMAGDAGSNLSIASGFTATLAGTTELSGKVTGKGTLAVGAHGTMDISSGASLSVAQWTISFDSSVTIGGDLTYAGMFVGGGTDLRSTGGSFRLTGTAYIYGMQLTGSHTFYTKGTTTLTQTTTNNSVFENDGALTQKSSNVYIGGSSGLHPAMSLINSRSGVWDIIDNHGILPDYQGEGRGA